MTNKEAILSRIARGRTDLVFGEWLPESLDKAP